VKGKEGWIGKGALLVAHNFLFIFLKGTPLSFFYFLAPKINLTKKIEEESGNGSNPLRLHSVS
jgi:hypothetical protein